MGRSAPAAGLGSGSADAPGEPGCGRAAADTPRRGLHRAPGQLGEATEEACGQAGPSPGEALSEPAPALPRPWGRRGRGLSQTLPAARSCPQPGAGRPDRSEGEAWGCSTAVRCGGTVPLSSASLLC